MPREAKSQDIDGDVPKVEEERPCTGKNETWKPAVTKGEKMLGNCFGRSWKGLFVFFGIS